MSLSNIKPTYPNGILPWTDRVDGQSVDFAEDINTTVADLESVETTLGTNPQIESSPPTGNSIKYSSVSARISDAMDNSQLPYVSLNRSTFTLPNSTGGTLLGYVVALDPYYSFNGTDFAAPASGWWVLTSTHSWQWYGDGYSHHFITLNGSGNILDEKFIDWEFPGNTLPSNEGTGIIPITVPRFWQFGKRNVITSCTWQGALNKGDRISVYAENGTSNPAHVIQGLTLKGTMTRKINGSFASG